MSVQHRKNQSIMRIRTRRAALACSVAALSLLLGACSGGAASSDDNSIKLVLADYSAATAAEVTALDWVWDEVSKRTNGRVSVEQNHQETLCKAAEIIQCVQDGRADIGYSVPSYTPSNFPFAEIMHLPFITSNAEAVALAYSQLIDEVPEIREENTSLGLEPLLYFTAAPALLGAEKPLDSIDDFNNLKVRAVGDGSLIALKAVGANPVAISANELYEGLQRGVVDAWVSSLTAGYDFNLFEVTTDWRDVGQGPYTTVGVWMSEASWKGLPEDVKEVFNEVLTEFLEGGKGYSLYAKQFDAKCDAIFDSGGVDSLKVWDESKTDQWRDAIGGEAVETWIKQAKSAGLSNADEVYAKYEGLLKDAEAQSDWVSPNAACADKFTNK